MKETVTKYKILLFKAKKSLTYNGKNKKIQMKKS